MQNNSIDKRLQKLELRIITPQPIAVFYVDNDEEKQDIENDNDECIVFIVLKSQSPHPLQITRSNHA